MQVPYCSFFWPLLTSSFVECFPYFDKYIREETGYLNKYPQNAGNPALGRLPSHYTLR